MPSAPVSPSTTATPPIGVIGIQGRNGSDPTLLIPDNQCLEAMNTDFYRAGLARKRGGSANLDLTTSGTVFANGAVGMYRHVPGSDQSVAEYWCIDGNNVFHRLVGGVIWADVTSIDACTGTPQEVVFQTFNGKLYIAYKSAHNRLHVWDPANNSIRRTGLDTPLAPASVVLAGGAVTDTRKYFITWTTQIGGLTVRRSNIGPASASQGLSTQQATVTRPAVPGEGETHWELWGASTTSSFGDLRLVATTVIATTTAVDNAALPAQVSPAQGENTCPPSCRYMVCDGARLIMGGAYELAANAENAMAPKSSRIWWTAVLGSTTNGDDDSERVSNTGTINAYADLEEAVAGLSQPMQAVSSAANSLERGSFYVMSAYSQWKFISTGVVATPYLQFRITGGGGTVHHKSITTSVDANGNPAIYWASSIGPFRITADGQEFLGEDIVDLWATLNQDALIPCHSLYYPALRQIWFFIATGTSQYPNLRLVFDTRLGRMTQVNGVRFGWSVANGEAAKAYCSCLFSDTVAASMGKALKPYIGYTGSTAIWKCDTVDTDDVGNVFMAYIDSKSYAPWGVNKKGGIEGEPSVIAHTDPGVSIRLSIYKDEGADVSYSDAPLTDPSGSQLATLVFSKFENARLADSFTFRCRIGDAVATSNTWTLDGLIVPVVYQGDH